MFEEWALLIIGLVLIALGVLAQGVSRKAMPPVDRWYSVPLALRVVLCSVGILSMLLGVLRLSRK